MKVRSKRMLTLMLLCWSLSELRCAQLKDMASLRDQLAEQYHQRNIEMKLINGKALNVAFINSEFNALEPEAKKIKAPEIASFVKSHYASIEGIELIGIAFVISND